ncbi:MAG: hypothetical protein R3C04_11485 [Hyphomonas sp.]
MAFLPLPASAERSRPASLPGGGEVSLPSAYAPVSEGDYRWQDTGGLIAYRNYRSMMSGTRECDGMVAVARAGAHESLDAFVTAARAGLTTRWAFADESEGRWYGKEDVRFPVERRMGEDGEELSGQLSVHVVGLFGVSDKPARFFALDHRAGLRIAVWIFDRQGGEKAARRIADGIAASFSE